MKITRTDMGALKRLSAFVVGVILAAAGVMICYQSLQAVGAKHPPPGVERRSGARWRDRSARDHVVGEVPCRSPPP